MKKNESITYRTDAIVKQALTMIANEKMWSISQLSEVVIKQWLNENYPDLLKELIKNQAE